jgi:DNA uptake protein ComE-like DNA-binding protein
MNWLKKTFSAKSLDGLSPAALRNLNNRKWRWANSKWLWLVWGLAGGYGIILVIQGSRFQSMRLIASGVLSFVLLIIGISIIPPANEDDTPVEPGFIIPIMLAFFLCFGAAHYFNRDVLVEKARRLHSPKDDWLKTNFGVTAPVGESIDQKMDLGTEQLLAANGLVPEGLVIQETEQVKKRVITGLLNINTASLQDIVTLGIFSDDRVMAIIQQRDSRPFQSLDELRVFLDLKPHELAEVKKVIEVQSSPPMVPKNPSGRIVDL